MSFTIIAGARQGLLTDASVVFIDAATSVSVKLPNKVTSHPVGNGSNISDHVFQNNAVIDIQGVMTNYPFHLPRDSGPNRVRDSYRKLRTIYNSREFVTVRTELAAYTNCIITSLTFPESPQTGDSLHFSVTLEQVQIVEPEAVITSPALLDRILNNQKTGNKTAVDSENQGNSATDQATINSSANWFDTNTPELTRVVRDFNSTVGL